MLKEAHTRGRSRRPATDDEMRQGKRVLKKMNFDNRFGLKVVEP